MGIFICICCCDEGRGCSCLLLPEGRVFGAVILAVQHLLSYSPAQEGDSALNFPGLSAVDLLQSYWHFWWEFYDFFLASLVHILFSLEPVLAPRAFLLEAPVINAFGCGNSCRDEFCHHLWGYGKNRWRSVIYAKYYPQNYSYLISTAVLV